MRYLPAVLATAALIFSTSAMSEEYPAMNLKIAHFVPANFPASKVDKWFADEVNKRSGGKIKIRIFWAESMGKATELVDLVGSGAIDMAVTSPGFFPNKLPLFGATNSLMMQFKGNSAATRVMPEMVEKFPAIQDELKRANVYPIFFHGLTQYRPLCSKKIEKIEDFKGLKMRSWGEYIPLMWESLGATPVSVMTPDLYESLQRGTIDCTFYPTDLSYFLKLYEVAKFTWAGENGFGAIPTAPIYVNWKTWHEVWPENVRKLMTEVGREAMEKDIKETFESELKAQDNMVKNHGVKIVEFRDMDKVRSTVPDLTAAWIEKMKTKGLGKEAQEIADFWRKRGAELDANAKQ